MSPRQGSGSPQPPPDPHRSVLHTRPHPSQAQLLSGASEHQGPELPNGATVGAIQQAEHCEAPRTQTVGNRCVVMQDGALRGVPSQHVPMFLVAPTPRLLGETRYHQASWTSHNPLSTPTIPHRPQSRPTPRPTAAGTPPPALPFTDPTLTSPISHHQVTCPPPVLPTLTHDPSGLHHRWKGLLGPLF